MFSILFIDKYEYVFTILIIYVQYIIYINSIRNLAQTNANKTFSIHRSKLESPSAWIHLPLKLLLFLYLPICQEELQPILSSDGFKLSYSNKRSAPVIKWKRISGKQLVLICSKRDRLINILPQHTSSAPELQLVNIYFSCH